MAPPDCAFLLASVRDAFLDVAKEAAERVLELAGQASTPSAERVAVSLGMISGDESLKGRVLLDGDAEQIRDIAEGMNGEPLETTTDLYFFIGEFANMFCGRAVTVINNAYRGTEFRLTPLAILAGLHMDITTPSIRSESFAFAGGGGDCSSSVSPRDCGAMCSSGSPGRRRCGSFPS
jgi:CheY-specific phosphatase CheX